jgi:hypothetical protein
LFGAATDAAVLKVDLGPSPALACIGAMNTSKVSNAEQGHHGFEVAWVAGLAESRDGQIDSMGRLLGWRQQGAGELELGGILLELEHAARPKSLVGAAVITVGP